MSSFLIFVLSCFGESRQFPGAGSFLRSGAGLEDVLHESCGGDVEDEAAPEFDDNPGTTMGTIFPFCKNGSSLAWSTVVLYRWPTHKFV